MPLIGLVVHVLDLLIDEGVLAVLDLLGLLLDEVSVLNYGLESYVSVILKLSVLEALPFLDKVFGSFKDKPSVFIGEFYVLTKRINTQDEVLVLSEERSWLNDLPFSLFEDVVFSILLFVLSNLFLLLLPLAFLILLDFYSLLDILIVCNGGVETLRE